MNDEPRPGGNWNWFWAKTGQVSSNTGKIIKSFSKRMTLTEFSPRNRFLNRRKSGFSAANGRKPQALRSPFINSIPSTRSNEPTYSGSTNANNRTKVLDVSNHVRFYRYSRSFIGRND